KSAARAPTSSSTSPVPTASTARSKRSCGCTNGGAGRSNVACAGRLTKGSTLEIGHVWLTQEAEWAHSDSCDGWRRRNRQQPRQSPTLLSGCSWESIQPHMQSSWSLGAIQVLRREARAFESPPTRRQRIPALG